jgi:oligopeptide/dipeptide ABC transporter ATP-binding protein
VRPLLTVDSLTVSLPIDGRRQAVVDGISFSILPGESLGLVGESGAGKSVTARSLIRLLPPAARVGGAITFEGRRVDQMGPAELRGLRARDIAMIFQDPRAHMDPVRRIGDFLTESLRRVMRISRQDALARVLPLLSDVGIDDPDRRLNQYPHQLSGGLLQRVTIAAALAVEPKLLLADEPTTALDVSMQAEVVALLNQLRQQRGLAMLFITHDLDLAAGACDQIAVMYAGAIAELQPASVLCEHPSHPYTAGLEACRPGIHPTGRLLPVIPGMPVAAFEAPDGCAFAPRCRFAEDACVAERPPLRPAGQGASSCRRAHELAGLLSGSLEPERSDA